MKSKLLTRAALLLVLIFAVMASPVMCLAYTQDAAAAEPVKPAATAEPTDKAAVTLTPDGQGTVVDNVTDEDGKEFFTITTDAGNIFFLVIDRQRESDNVYFLNAVTEADLMALAEKDEESEKATESAIPEPEPLPVCTCDKKCVPGEVDASCPVCVLNWKDCACTVTAQEETEPEPEQPKQKGGTNPLLLLLVLALAGGAGYYFKVYKPKKELEDAEDLEDLIGGDEETINEDSLEDAISDEELASYAQREPAQEMQGPGTKTATYGSPDDEPDSGGEEYEYYDEPDEPPDHED